MRESQLKTPGVYGHGQRVRRETANMISTAELSTMYNAGTPTVQAKAIAAFLLDAAQQCPGYEAPPAPPLPATQVVVANGAAVKVIGATGSTQLVPGTAAVATSTLTGVRLAATAGVVTNGQTIAVTGGTVTITVAANVVTAAFTATP